MHGRPPIDGVWLQSATCASHPHPEWWHSHDPREIDAAVAHCRNHCLVAEDCLAFALATGVKGSVWGGTTQHERTQMLHRNDRLLARGRRFRRASRRSTKGSGNVTTG